MSQNDCIGKTLKPWPILVDHYTAEKINHRLSEEIRKVNGSMSLIKIVTLKRHLKHAQYRKGFWEHGLDEVELDEREKKWVVMLLRDYS